jgi:hypothetical protein
VEKISSTEEMNAQVNTSIDSAAHFFVDRSQFTAQLAFARRDSEP